ncbi:hypothetical protein TVAG_143720 [Trichomonas vaginalis G3]|uniref:Uncharacterized protein n=1 Tax=Trichomonas vaginalis (strain ATCC PRA-98 / G3) TaxID=412133 RepID=A2GKP0_TRIV3|nr:hypothetical protein TVAGG3_0635270 [Trichomonas vaginalis G3]EAX82277.1 hypothetical protein TVAG_143720 [Trichomonas vaginalis G3]KAI5504816.1 hypothetical protein TVAGG3_0635270 [Trichomonas vaginalis G3]|eukprot:XP_001295207.1 hypothetical protein [Trichomonas vaginalis G3]
MIEEKPPNRESFQYYTNIGKALGVNVSSDDLMTHSCAGISFGYTEAFTHALDVFFTYFVWDQSWHDQHLFNALQIW